MFLTEIEAKDVPEEIQEFTAISCMACSFSGEINQRWFISNAETEQDLTKLFEKFDDIHKFSVMTHDDGVYCSAQKCPKCNSEDIFIDC